MTSIITMVILLVKLTNRTVYLRKCFQGVVMKTNYSVGQKSPVNQASKTTIFYFSGTGNSLWIARDLARQLGNTEIFSMVDWDINQHNIDSQVIGLIFPVHMWGVPKRVLDFLDRLRQFLRNISLLLLTMPVKYLIPWCNCIRLWNPRD